jgi:hypothetical protein
MFTNSKPRLRRGFFCDGFQGKTAGSPMTMMPVPVVPVAVTPSPMPVAPAPMAAVVPTPVMPVVMAPAYLFGLDAIDFIL